MYGSMILMDVSECAAKAALIYPQIISILNDAGVPPDDRNKVMMYVMQVINAEDQECNLLQ